MKIAEGSDPSADVDRVARRLERIRELSFKSIPPVRTISADEAREEGLAALSREEEEHRLAAATAGAEQARAEERARGAVERLEGLTARPLRTASAHASAQSGTIQPVVTRADA